MTRYEFLQKLQEELSGKISASAVQEQMDYYDRYIRDEVGNGRSEVEVLEELGDPWAIARTILDASENEEFARENTTYEARRASGNSRKDRGASAQVHVFGFDSWWKKLLLILGIIGIIMVIVGVVGGIISLLAPIVIPIVVIWLVIRMIKGRK